MNAQRQPMGSDTKTRDSFAGDGPLSRLRIVWDEIRDRKVLRVSVAYLLVGWLVMQVAELLVEALQLPDWSFTLIVILMALGFPMAVILAWAYEITPEGIRRDGVRALDGADRARDGAPAVERASDEEFRVVILPPRDLTAEQNLDWFCDGLAAELQAELSHLRDVVALSRDRAGGDETGDLSLEQLARRLDLDALLEGSVRAADGQYRIGFQLVSARTRFDIWNQRFNCARGDELGLQQSLAIEVAEAVKLTLRERPADSSGLDCDPIAYEYLQRGREFFRGRCAKRTAYAIQMFEKATGVDARYGTAWAYLACALGYARLTYDASPETLSVARAAAEKAMDLAPHEAMSWVAKGILLSNEHRHEDADEAFSRATSLDPDCFEGWYFNGRNWARQGDLEKAADLFRRASEADLADYQSVLLQAQLFVSLGRPERVEPVLNEGIARAERSLERHPDDYRALNLGALGLLQLGQQEKARAWMRQSLENAPRDPVIEYNAACFYALAGDAARAMASLRRCRDMGVLDDGWWLHDSHLDALRNLPEFKALADETQPGLAAVTSGGSASPASPPSLAVSK